MVVNAKLGWQNDHVGIFAFATNLFDADYVQSTFINGDGRRLGIIGDSRIIGLSLEGRF